MTPNDSRLVLSRDADVHEESPPALVAARPAADAGFVPHAGRGGETGGDGSEQGACRNCGAHLHGPFCSECGQRRKDGSLTFRDLATHLVDILFDVRRGVLRSLLLVAYRPGRFARRYLDGQRKRFVNPLTLFLIVVTAVFFGQGLFHEIYVAEIARSTHLSVPDEAFEEGGTIHRVMGVTSREEYAEMTFELLKRFHSYLTIFICVIAGLVLRLFLPGRTVAENTVFQMCAITQSNLLCFFVYGPMMYLGVSQIVTTACTLAVMFLVQVAAGWEYFEDRWKGAVLAPIAFVMSYAVVLGGVIVVVIVYAVGTHAG